MVLEIEDFRMYSQFECRMNSILSDHTHTHILHAHVHVYIHVYIIIRHTYMYLYIDYLRNDLTTVQHQNRPAVRFLHSGDKVVCSNGSFIVQLSSWDVHGHHIDYVVGVEAVTRVVEQTIHPSLQQSTEHLHGFRHLP